MTSVELGAESAVSRAAGSARLTAAVWTIRHGALGLVRAPGLPYQLACLTAIATAFVGSGEAVRSEWLTAAAVVVMLSPDLATTGPRTSQHDGRDRAQRAVKRLLGLVGAGLLGASAASWLTAAEIRRSLAVVVAATAVIAATVVLAGLARGPRTVLLVGGRLGVGQLLTQWATCSEIDVKGVCLPEVVDESADELLGVPVLGSIDDVVGVVSGLRVDEVVVAAGPLMNAYEVRRLSWALEGTPVELSVAADVHGIVPRRIAPHTLGRRMMLSVRPGRRSRHALWAKGAVDRVAATLLLLALAPVLVTVGLLVRRDSPGPALFKQTRVGFGGEHFELYKFRTMVVDAEAKLGELICANEAAGPLFKMAADPRMTRIGRFLRSTSLDELPQLVNVIKGEMSLIGPRPSLPVEVTAYDAWVYRRLGAKPGMTGAWQVGGRSSLNWSESVRLDIDYVDNATFRDDLRIAAKTVRVVVSREGAV